MNAEACEHCGSVACLQASAQVCRHTRKAHAKAEQRPRQDKMVRRARNK